MKSKKTKTSRYDNIEEEIVPAAELDPARVFLLYGRQGVGKTYLAASSPKPLIIDTEMGTAGIRRVGGVRVLRVNHFPMMDSIYWYLKDGKHPYETVVIDTLTRLVSHALRYVAGGDTESKKQRLDEIRFTSKRDWGAATELMKDVIIRFSSLSLNVIFTAHETTYEIEDEEIVSGPVVNPGVRQVLLGHVDITGRLVAKEVKKEGKKHPQVERRLLLGLSESFESKDRSGILPSTIRRPNMTEIINLLRKDQ
jgi:hypothetical protein